MIVPPCPIRLMARARDELRADDVDLDDPAEHGLDLIAALGDGRQPFEAGIVDENIDPR